MSNIALSGDRLRSYSVVSRGALALALLIGGWFMVALFLGANNFFVTKGGGPPLALLLGVGSPVVAFLIAFQVSHSFRELVLRADLRLITAVQAWRIAGYSFLILHSYGLLSGLFAWPAGVGDMVIGVTAPLVAYLAQKPGFVSGRTFLAWNLFGILDLVAAPALGALSVVFAGSGGHIANTPMTQLPLVLIPTFFVPSLLILHFVALFKSRLPGQQKTI